MATVAEQSGQNAQIAEYGTNILYGSSFSRSNFSHRHTHIAQWIHFTDFEGNSKELFSRKLIKFEFKNIFTEWCAWRRRELNQRKRNSDRKCANAQAAGTGTKDTIVRLFSAFVQTWSSSFGCAAAASCCYKMCVRVCVFTSYWRTDSIRRNSAIEQAMESFMKIAWIFEMVQRKLIPPKTINSQDYKGFCLLTKFLLRAIAILCVCSLEMRSNGTTALFCICALQINHHVFTNRCSFYFYLPLTPPSSSFLTIFHCICVLSNIFNDLNVYLS